MSHIISTCVPLINSPNTLHIRDEPSYLLYRKQTPYSFAVTQTSNKAKRKEGHSLLPIKRGSVFYHFSLRVAKLLQGILSSIAVILLSTIEN